MARKGSVAPSLALFPEEPPSSEEAWEIVERVPLRASFLQQRKRCAFTCCKAGASHGPYWYARFVRFRGGPEVCVYVGSDAKKRRIERAHVIVRRELAEADRAADSPERRRFARMVERAGVAMPGEDHTTKEVRIIGRVK